MKKQKIIQQALDDISVSDAKKIGRALYNYRLTQQWLILRLDKDWGVKINYTLLSEVIAGKRALGPKPSYRIYFFFCFMKFGTHKKQTARGI